MVEAREPMEVINPPSRLEDTLPIQDVAALRAALPQADTPTLLMAYTHISGDDSLLEPFSRYIEPVMYGGADIPDDLAKLLHEKLVDLLTREPSKATYPPSHDLIRRMMDVYTGEHVADEFVPLLLEQSGMTGLQGVDLSKRVPAPADFKVLIAGAGLCGIAAGVKLQEAGYDYEIIEASDEVGGTWHQTNYPGLAVDTPSHFYSYSFELNANWPHFFTRGYNNQDYLLHTAKKYGVRDRVTFQHEVVSAIWDEQACMWDVTIRSVVDGSTHNRRVNALISAGGFVRAPNWPDIPGRDDFTGIKMHSADWNHDVNLEGLRIAVIGTGASSMQISTYLAQIASQLTVFQRLKRWVMPIPHINREVPEGAKWAMRNIPHYAQWYRLITYWWTSDGLYAASRVDPNWPHQDVSVSEANHRFRQRLLDYIDSELADHPGLKPKVTPDYPAGGIRLCMDAGWFDMLKQDNVELETSGIERIVENGIVTKDGNLIEVDAIIFATGYAGRRLSSLHIVGLDGLTLAEAWREPEDIKPLRGMAVPGFPNLFMIAGPGTVAGHGAGVNMLAENQANMVLGLFDLLLSKGARSIEANRAAAEEYNRQADEQLRNMIWNHPTIRHRYSTPKGRLMGYYPWQLVKAWHDSRRPNPDEFLVR